MRSALAALGLATVLLGSTRGVLAQQPSASTAPAEQPPSSTAVERVNLPEAIRRAQAANPTAVVAAQEIRRAQALVRQARASSFPTLTGNAVLTRLDHARELGGRVFSAANQQSANVNLTVPLIAPQRWVAWSTAKDNLQVATASNEDVRRTVALNTARAYLAVISQHRILEVNKRAVSTARAHFEFAKSQFEGGVGTRIDQVRGEQEMATSENQLLLSNIALIKAQEALGVLVGAQGPVDASDDVSLPSAPDLSSAMQEAASRRADVRAAQQRLHAAERRVRNNWADYMPLIVGTFQPFYQHPATLVTPQTGWQAQLILTLPLYDGGLRYGAADERRALENEGRAQLDAALRQARSEVRASVEALRNADEALDAARRAAQLAGQSLELANIAYRAGASTNLEVIDAERRARDAETTAVIAEDTARQARLDLLAASGRFP